MRIEKYYHKGSGTLKFSLVAKKRNLRYRQCLYGNMTYYKTVTPKQWGNNSTVHHARKILIFMKKDTTRSLDYCTKKWKPDGLTIYIERKR